jgi:hypothetical protein
MKIIQNNSWKSPLLATLKMFNNIATSLLWYTSASRKCIIGYDTTGVNSTPSVDQPTGTWIFDTDSTGRKMLIVKEDVNSDLNSIENISSFLKGHENFSSINLSHSKLCDELLDLIANNPVNRNCLQTINLSVNEQNNLSTPLISVTTLRRLIQICSQLKRVELSYFDQLKSSDLVFVFKSPSSVIQLRVLVGKKGYMTVQTLFEIFDASPRLEYIQAVWLATPCKRLVTIQRNRIGTFRRCASDRDAFHCCSYEDDLTRGRFEVFRKDSQTYRDYVRLGHVCCPDTQK